MIPDAAAGASRAAAAAGGARPLETEYRPRHPLDLRRTVMFQRRGTGDPSMVWDGASIWRASRTPEGVATIALRAAPGGAVRAVAWGPGAAWALGQLPALCGALDELDGFDAARHPLVASAHHLHPGLRLGRTDLVFDALAGAIVEQKVTGKQAFGAWRRLVTWYGEPAPGPTPRPMHAPPTIEGWRRIPSWAWHRAGLEPAQSRTIVETARRGDSVVRAVTAAADGEGRERVLVALRGVGAWTSAETRIKAFGDPDAVSVGDYHLGHEIGFAFDGVRGDDARMLELLAPWSGHRQRVIRLLALHAPREPRRGPRMSVADHRTR